MGPENNNTREMRRFLERGFELLVQGAENVDLNLRRPVYPRFYDYQEYSLVIGGQEYDLTYERRRGGFDSRYCKWNTRVQVIVAFTPDARNNLRFIDGGESKLPTLTVFEEEGKFNGILEFDKYSVQRSHWWLYVVDFLTKLDLEHTFRIQHDYVGSDRGADQVLRNLNRRLVSSPSSITAVNPDQWRIRAEALSNF